MRCCDDKNFNSGHDRRSYTPSGPLFRSIDNAVHDDSNSKLPVVSDSSTSSVNSVLLL